jgi:hypothetical protein
MPVIEDAERSGRVLVRMPISLHDYLVGRARAECVSLNMFIVSVLAGECGWAAPEGPRQALGDLRREIEVELWRDREHRLSRERRAPRSAADWS